MEDCELDLLARNGCQQNGEHASDGADAAAQDHMDTGRDRGANAEGAGADHSASHPLGLLAGQECGASGELASPLGGPGCPESPALRPGGEDAEAGSGGNYGASISTDDEVLTSQRAGPSGESACRVTGVHHLTAGADLDGGGECDCEESSGTGPSPPPRPRPVPDPADHSVLHPPRFQRDGAAAGGVPTDADRSSRASVAAQLWQARLEDFLADLTGEEWPSDLTRFRLLGHECRVCYTYTLVERRPCCGLMICRGCYVRYLSARVSQGAARLECPNTHCAVPLPRFQVASSLPSPELKRLFRQLAVDEEGDPTSKTCPRCGQERRVEAASLRRRGVAKGGLRVTCAGCALEWCFPCHAPWHKRLTCREFRAGDKQFRAWVRGQDESRENQSNAHQCPGCKVRA